MNKQTYRLQGGPADGKELELHGTPRVLIPISDDKHSLYYAEYYLTRLVDNTEAYTFCRAFENVPVFKENNTAVFAEWGVKYNLDDLERYEEVEITDWKYHDWREREEKELMQRLMK